MVGYKQQSAPQSTTNSNSLCATTHDKSPKVNGCHRTENRTPRLPMNPNVTFFEMVTPPQQLVRSHSADFNPKFGNRKPKIIAIIEENTSAPIHVNPKSWPTVHGQGNEDQSFSSSNSSSTSSTSISCATFSDELEEEEIDKLDASLLPDFFTYTSAEREFIRQYQPVIFQNQRKQLSLGESSETSCFWAT